MLINFNKNGFFDYHNQCLINEHTFQNLFKYKGFLKPCPYEAHLHYLRVPKRRLVVLSREVRLVVRFLIDCKNFQMEAIRRVVTATVRAL